MSEDSMSKRGKYAPKALTMHGVSFALRPPKSGPRKRRRCDGCGASVVDEWCALCEAECRAPQADAGDFDELVDP